VVPVPVQVVVLLGAPGSGKTSVGRALGERGWRWREWEVELVGEWGRRDEFLANKETEFDTVVVRLDVAARRALHPTAATSTASCGPRSRRTSCRHDASTS
jgi:hypothetical protein